MLSVMNERSFQAFSIPSVHVPVLEDCGLFSHLFKLLKIYEVVGGIEPW